LTQDGKTPNHYSTGFSRQGLEFDAVRFGGLRKIMFETARSIHAALGTDSTLVFVLVVALGFAVVGGGVAWLVDKGYKNEKAERQSTSQPAAQTKTTEGLPKSSPTEQKPTVRSAASARPQGSKASSKVRDQDRSQPSAINQTMTNSSGGIQSGGDVTIGQKPSPAPTEKDRKP
jgi:hypothetical protein